ncbi:MAG: APC family permease [Actinomycetota bacterium]
MNRIFKRILVGRPISTHEELHHRLSKKIALAVFSSDALSSSAYATDEILLVLILAGVGALSLGVPIALAVAFVLTVVVMSYRQTVRAYPSGGGAYIVAHRNLGPFPGLIAASSLLVDYVLTVSVSVAAGMAAVGAAFPDVRQHRLPWALAIVGLITVLNLRGLKESGTVFAIPTYGFLISMGAMILIGAYKVIAGQVPPAHEIAKAAETTAGISLFLIARAFASGSTALTGVEAISNGVPAFEKPESKNAAQTLLVLGFLLTFLFLGVTFLAKAFHVDPHLIEQGQTVTSQIAGRVFGRSNAMFFTIQVFTALILFLAANTSYADFPRLASILATDRYLPRSLQNRGDRLAFSNGIVVLAAAASAVLMIYKADVHKIIPLYVVGVFTSFTLSQSGMVRHTRQEAKRAETAGKPEPRGWKRAMAINGFGALTTFIVLVIVATTKFKSPDVAWSQFYTKGGAWQVIILIPVVALLLRRVGSHYRHVSEQLRQDRSVPRIESNRVVLVVSRLRGATKALAFARAIAPRELRVISLRATGVRLTDLRNRWETMGVTTPIESVGDRISDVAAFIESMSPTALRPVTIILPDPQYPNYFGQLLRGRFLLRMKRALLYQPGVVVISVPFAPLTEPEPKRLQAPGRLAIIVVVSAVHRATVQAIRYATSLNPSEIKALSIQTDPGEAAKISGEWADKDWELDVPLEIVDSPYRSLLEPLLREVRELRPNPEDAVAVVVPEFLVPHLWQRALHNQTALLIKFALLFEPNVVVINVPYRIEKTTD